MIKKINIADIQLDNYSVRESLMNIERNAGTTALYTIEEVSMHTLLLAKEDEVLKEVLQNLSETIIADTGILEAAGEANSHRKKEIEGHTFFYEFMKRLDRNHKKVFILAEIGEKVEEFLQFIEEEYPKCEVVGAVALAHVTDELEAVVNEINAADPDVIISVVPSPVREHFLAEHVDMLSTGIWYGLDPAKFSMNHHKITGMFRQHFMKRKLTAHISDYEEMNGSEEENQSFS